MPCKHSRNGTALASHEHTIQVTNVCSDPRVLSDVVYSASFWHPRTPCQTVPSTYVSFCEYISFEVKSLTPKSYTVFVILSNVLYRCKMFSALNVYFHCSFHLIPFTELPSSIAAIMLDSKSIAY